MSFATWAALAVAFLVAAPVVAHLLRRRPPDEQPFAPSRLVPVMSAVAERKHALEDRALFAVRSLSVLALAVLGATPFLSCNQLSLARNKGASLALAIVLDDSHSMRAALPGTSTTRFARAKSGAKELLDGVEKGDVVALVLAGRPARVVLAATSELELGRAALDAVTPSDRGTDLDGAVHLASELVGGLAHVDKRVVVLSDLAGGSGSPEALDVPEGIALWTPLEELARPLDDCGVIEASRRGAAVTVRVACSGKAFDEAGIDSRATVDAPASASSKATERSPEFRTIAGRRLVLLDGTSELGSVRLSLDEPARDLAITLSDAALASLGERALYAVLEGKDDLPSNDEAPVLGAGAQLTVGVLSDTQADRLATGGAPIAEQALHALGAGLVVMPLDAVPTLRGELEGLALLIADDVPGFTPRERRELGAWLEQGGVMLLTLGPRAAAAPLGSGYAPMLPGLVRWKTTASRGMKADHDAIFASAEDGMAELAPRGRALLELEANSDVRTLARWEDDQPLVVERRIGRGLALTVTLPFSTHESDLALRPGFIALLDRAASAARASRGAVRATVGTPWTFAGEAEVSAVRTPRLGAAIPVVVSKSHEGSRLEPDTLGRLEVTVGGRKSVRVAAADEAEILAVPRAVSQRRPAESLGGASRRVDVSPQIAVVLLGLFLGELVLRLATTRSSGTRAS